MLGHQPAGVLDRHIPAAKIHHFGLQRAVGGVEGGLLRRGGIGRSWEGHGESFRATCCTLFTIGSGRGEVKPRVPAQDQIAGNP